MGRFIKTILAAVAVAVLCLSGASATAAGPWSTATPIYAASSIQAQGYSYAPSGIAGPTERYYVCHSRASGDIRDDVFLVKRSGGSVTSSASVLTASASGWDSYHICDPSVVRVNAVVGGQSYTYAMFYLGNDQNCSCHNQIGVAVANSLDGPWIKSPQPVVAFASGVATSQWGVGQPSATTVDAASGTVALFWTEGYSTGTKGRMALVDLNGGSGAVVSGVHDLTTSGLLDANGAQDFLNNFDVVYSPQRDRFYIVRERHPYPSSSPSYISTTVEVLSLSGSNAWSGVGTWSLEGRIGPVTSGAPRTHNPGFLRTEFGTLPDESSLTVLFSTATLDPNSLWTYSIASSSAAL